MLNRLKIYIKYLFGAFYAPSFPNISGSVIITGANVTMGANCRLINCSVVGPVILGDYVSIADFSLIKGTKHAGVSIGTGTIIGPFTIISSDYHTRINGRVNNAFIKREYGAEVLDNALADVRLPIQIGEDCWIGMGVYIKPGVKIGNRVTVGANSVILNNVSDDKVVSGVYK